MKLRVKFNGIVYSVDEIDETTTINQLKTRVGRLINIENFSLTLNQRDALDGTAGSSSALKDNGIVNGDTLYVILSSSQTAPKSIAVEKSANFRTPSPSRDEPTTSGQHQRATLSKPKTPTDSSLQVVEKFEKSLRELNPTSSFESLVICIHTLLVERGFMMVGSPPETSKELPQEWRRSLKYNISDLSYSYPGSVTLNVSTLVHRHGEKTFAAVTASCVLGDNPEIRKIDLYFKDYFEDINSARCKDVESALSLCRRLQTDLIDSLAVLVIGDWNCPFMNVPYDLKARIALLLSVTEFSRLSLANRELHKLWDDERIWKYFLKRDFGDEAVRDADQRNDDTRYRQAYRQRFIARKEREQRQSLWEVAQPVSPHPPQFVTDPDSYHYPPLVPQVPGVLGGGHDLNPLGHFPHPAPRPGFPPPYNRPPLVPGGPYRPFQPHIRPVSPYDPDAGLFGPRPPGRGPGPRNPYNPFGGGPRFPGGNFF